jgi:hypothetical protein
MAISARDKNKIAHGARGSKTQESKHFLDPKNSTSLEAQRENEMVFVRLA